ncbi:hypothetical protein ADIWIN_3968 [Winogradskyella psychrotolerans RS-3]|uniref:Uncharacterized protein n=1 Tax=Winogradskyella psychrotolerans RS-3 TaxID=641526 RepID=S7VIU3_9FLAO|nr:hypothetical protein [Winogradskyella psychrotolerans]EPR69896.1 hypothetical protein ADIWIN_3968 [Winogradskyella psychrotolerans RS-3]
MKQTFVIALIYILISFNSCKEVKNEPKKSLVEQTEIDVEEQFYFDCKKQLINGIEYEACIKRPGIFTIKNSKEEVVFSQEENPFDFEFNDFNEDGYIDVIMNYATNSPGHQDLLIYDKDKDIFSKVESFYNYPNAKKIGESNLYYSYHASGCADNDWGSELYELTGTNITLLGKINGLGCLENDTNGIYIYKVNGDDEKLLKYIKREQGYWKGKYDFIAKYWTENKNKFE